jgi:hypothetical protein
MGKLEAPSERLGVLRETIDIVAGEPEKKLAIGLLKKGSDLNERMLEFFGKVFGPLERGEHGDKDLDERIDHVRDVVTELDRLRESIKLLSPLKYHPHPAERTSVVLAALRPAILESPEPRERLIRVLSLHDELSRLVEDEAALKHIERNESAIKRAIRGVAAAKLLHRLGRFGIKAAIPVSTALAVALVLYIYFQAQRGQDRRELALDVIAPALRGYDVALDDVDEERLSSVKGGNQEFAEFMNPLFVLGRPDGLKRVDSFEALGRWVEQKRQEKAGLEYIGGLARDESLKRIRGAVVKIGDEAAGHIRTYLAARAGAVLKSSIAQATLAVELEEMHRELEGLKRMAESLRDGGGDAIANLVEALDAATKATAPENRVPVRVATADQWTAWLENSTRLTLDTGVPEVDGALLEVLHLARLFTAVESLTDHSRAIFWSEKAAADYVSYLRDAAAALTTYGDHVRGSAALNALRAKLPAEPGGTTDAIHRKVWKVVHGLLNRAP